MTMTSTMACHENLVPMILNFKHWMILNFKHSILHEFVMQAQYVSYHVGKTIHRPFSSDVPSSPNPQHECKHGNMALHKTCSNVRIKNNYSLHTLNKEGGVKKFTPCHSKKKRAQSPRITKL